VGSGLAAFGVITELIKKSDLQIDLWDIGHTSPDDVPHPFRKLPNSLPINDSYYPYGLNDSSHFREISSKRLCSSHAWQGFATVYSGSMVCPAKAELVSWPETAIPSEYDYLRPLEHFYISSSKTDQDSLHSCGYLDLNQHLNNTAVSTISSVAVHRSAIRSHTLTPFTPGKYFSKLIDSKRISYYPKRNILYLMQDEELKLSLFYELKESKKSSPPCILSSDYKYDAIFMAAGCINTTSIVDLSLRKLNIIQSAKSFYPIQSCPIMTMVHLRVPGKKLNSDLRTRRDSGLCTHFYEKYIANTSSWSHSQFGFIGTKQIQSIKGAALLSILSPILAMLLKPLTYSLTVFHSKTAKSGVITCQLIVNQDQCDLHQVSVSESEYIPDFKVGVDLFIGIINAFKDLRVIPIPLSSWITRQLRSSDSGGWHVGGTLPFTENPTQPHFCHPSGELSGISGLFICDSSTFPTIPGSTIAFTTIANSSRIASKWVRDNSEL